jgi:hypothetical protein
MSAETLGARDVLAFFWNWRWELLGFLVWTGQMEKEARKRG